MSWYRSPSGHLTHADGPSQVAALTGRGYTPVPDEEAVAEVAEGADLVVDAADTSGTFDADAVNTAVRDEAPPTARARRRKG